MVCLIAASACLPSGSVPTEHRSTAHREIISIEAMDPWYATVAALPCIRRQPDLGRMVAGPSEGRHLAWLSYRRVERGERVVLRDVQLLESAWHGSTLNPCILAAIEGLSFHDPDVTRRRGHLASGDSRYRLSIPANLSSRLLRELDARH